LNLLESQVTSLIHLTCTSSPTPDQSPVTKDKGMKGNVQNSLSFLSSQFLPPFAIFQFVLLLLLDDYSLVFPSTTGFLELGFYRRQDVLEIRKRSDQVCRRSLRAFDSTIVRFGVRLRTLIDFYTRGDQWGDSREGKKGENERSNKFCRFACAFSAFVIRGREGS